MSKQLFYTLLTTIFFTLFFNGCSSEDITYDSSLAISNDSNITDTKVSGRFIDEAVSGLIYECSSDANSSTDANGTFSCDSGDSVRFGIGDFLSISITVTDDMLVTPYTLFPTSLDSAVNFARLVQSIDANSSDSIITIDKTLEALLPSGLDFGSLTFENDVESALGIELVSAAEAKTKLDATIVSEGGVIPEYDSSGEDGNITNTAPVITSVSDINVTENELSVLSVTATDADGDTLTYSISGTDSSSFDIDATSGVLSFKTAPNYESKNSYQIQTIASDSTDATSQDLNISILDVAEVPTLLDTKLSINENQAAASEVGRVSLYSGGDNNEITDYNLSGSGSENFSIDATGLITTLNPLDYELITSYSLKAKATNPTGDSAEVDVHIGVNNLIDEKPLLVDTTVAVLENASVGLIIGQLSISKIGDSPISSIVLSVGGVENTNFIVDKNGTVKLNTALDYEGTQEYNLDAQATNAAGDSNIVNLKVVVNNVLDVVPELADTTLNIDEDASAGANLGNITITTGGDSSISAIELSGTGSENFNISTSGAISVAAGASLDYETTTQYTLSAVATNGAGDSDSVTLTIDINDVQETPVLADTVLSVDENKISGAVVGSISITTTGTSAITSIILSGDGSGNFVSDTAGEITLSSSVDIDYETKTSYALSAVATNASGDSESVDITIDINDIVYDPTEMDKVQAGDAEANDYFGVPVAISGEYILVGAPSEDYNGFSDAGSAYLFKIAADGSVSQSAKIFASDASNGDNFGKSVAIDGDVVVIGAPNNNGYGSAYIFTLDASGVLSAEQKIELSSPAANDTFGKAVAVSGDYIVVSAPNKASAYLYELNASSVASYKDEISEGGLASDEYGISVAVDGDYIVIGASGEDLTGSDQGAAYVYEINTATDTVGTGVEITAPTPANSDYFGISVDLSGSYVVVGAYQQDDVAAEAGSAYLYTIDNSTTVTHRADIQPADIVAGDYFAYSVGVEGIHIALGAHKQTVGGFAGRGSAYVYEIDTSAHTVSEIEKLDASTSAVDDFFGMSVAVDKDYVAVGAINDDTAAANGGAVYLFDGEPAP